MNYRITIKIWLYPG